jgi:hypothetical protein
MAWSRAATGFAALAITDRWHGKMTTMMQNSHHDADA